MTTITQKDNVITVSGHSGYAVAGQDIVCAAISTLTQTFLATMDNLYPNRIKYAINEDMAIVEIQLNEDLNQDETILLKSFFIGVRGVAEAYPEHVKIVRESASKP